MPGPSIPWPPASWRLRWGKRPRRSPMPWTPTRPIASPRLGGTAATATMRKEKSPATRMYAPPGRPLRPCCPASLAPCPRSPRSIRPLRWAGSGPMTWPGAVRRWSSRPARWRCSSPSFWGSKKTAPRSKFVVAKGLTSVPGCEISPWPWELWGMSRPCAGPGWGGGMKNQRSA